MNLLILTGLSESVTCFYMVYILRFGIKVRYVCSPENS